VVEEERDRDKIEIRDHDMCHGTTLFQKQARTYSLEDVNFIEREDIQGKRQDLGLGMDLATGS